jgi:DNA adenine methylase
LGSKNRLAPLIAQRLHATGRQTLVDVFGGSAAVTLNTGFDKRIYNDIDGDLVNLFRVLADPLGRRRLLKKIRWTPPSREIYEKDGRGYSAHGFSFSYIADPVDRACAVLYRSLFTFGGKLRSGGFSISASNRQYIKEIGKYNAILRSIVKIGEFFRNTIIEHLHYQECIQKYGALRSAVLFVDPPYPDLQKYYSCDFSKADHVFLAHQLVNVPAPVVCTFYDNATVRSLYPETLWKYEYFEMTKNNQSRIYGVQKKRVTEVILTKL